MKWKLYILSFLGLFLLSFNYIYHYKNTFVVNFDIKIIQNDDRWIGELYYSNNNTYNPENRKQLPYKKHINSFQNIEVKIYNVNNLHYIRLDPLLNSGLIEIKNFTVTYLNQEQHIDFSILNNNPKHNIRIIEQKVHSMLIECTGEDPFIELSNHINFSKINVHNTKQAVFYAFILYLIFIFIFKLIKRFSLEKVILFSTLFIYTCYTLFFLSSILASYLLILFAFTSLLVALYNNPLNLINYIKYIGTFLLVYFVMSYLGFYMSTNLANPDYFYGRLPYIILALLIPIGFYNLKHFDMYFFKVILTILLISMALFIILLDQNIISIHNSNIFGLIMQRTNWTQKNYMFWYVLMMFGTLAFYNVKKRVDLLIIISILILSYFTIFGGYSLSAKLSYSIGLLVYIILSLFHIQKKHLLIIIWLFTFYIIFSPIIFALIDFTFLPKLVNRDAMYKTALALIKEHWLFGYGYGSTFTLQLKDFVSVIDLPKHYTNVFRGGHPHSLSLLFWLEFGVFGATFLAYYIHKLLAYIVENTYYHTNKAAIISMVVSFDIITSFSWSIWYPSVLLTFAFFGIMLTLSMNIKSLKTIQ